MPFEKENFKYFIAYIKEKMKFFFKFVQKFFFSIFMISFCKKEEIYFKKICSHYNWFFFSFS